MTRTPKKCAAASAARRRCPASANSALTRTLSGLRAGGHAVSRRPELLLGRIGFVAMATREAACHCGQLRLEVEGEPFAVSICNCLACQRRTGSAFGMQAGFKADQVQVSRPFRRLLAHLGRGGQEGARLPLLPRLRLAGLLHGADGAGPGRRLGRLVRRPVLPAADGVRLRLPPPSVGGAARLDPAASRPSCGTRCGPSTRPAGTRRRRTWRLELIEARPDQAYLYYNIGVLREPRGPAGRRRRAPPPRDRAVGRLPLHGPEGLGLRPDPRRAGVPGTARRLSSRPSRSRPAPATTRGPPARPAPPWPSRG